MKKINLGSAPNTGNGDSARIGGGKINENFQELVSFVAGYDIWNSTSEELIPKVELNSLGFSNLVSCLLALDVRVNERLLSSGIAADSFKLGGNLPNFYAPQSTTYTKTEVDDAIVAGNNSVVAQLLNNPDADVNSITELNNLIQGNLTVLSTKVSYTESQSLTSAQKLTAKTNIGLEYAALTDISNIFSVSQQFDGKVHANYGLHIKQDSDVIQDWLTIEDTDTTAGSQRPHILFKGNGTQIGKIRVLDNLGMQFLTGSSDDVRYTISPHGNHDFKSGTAIFGGNTYIRSGLAVIQNKSTTAGQYSQLSLFNSTNDATTPQQWLRAYRATTFGDGSIALGVGGADRFTIDKDGNANLTGNLTANQVKWGNSSTNNGNPRSLAIGYSGGNYGGFGYGIDFTSTSGVHKYVFNDNVTWATLNRGLQVYASAGGSVGSTVSWDEIFKADQWELSYKQQNIYHTGNLPTFDNYQYFNLKTNGTQRKTIQSTNNLNFIEQMGIGIDYSADGGVNIGLKLNSGGHVELDRTTALYGQQLGFDFISTNSAAARTSTSRISSIMETDGSSVMFLATESASGSVEPRLYLRETYSLSNTDFWTQGKFKENGEFLEDKYNKIGVVENKTVNTSTSYTITSTDKGKVTPFNSSSAITITINTSSLTNVDEITYVDAVGSGEITIAAGSGVTIDKNANRQLKSDGQYSRIAIHKTGASTYRVFGELKSV